MEPVAIRPKTKMMAQKVFFEALEDVFWVYDDVEYTWYQRRFQGRQTRRGKRKGKRKGSRKRQRR